MQAIVGYLILLLAMPLPALAVVLPANAYRAQGIDAPDCDGPLQVLIFALPVVLFYGVGTLLVSRAGRRFHRLVPFSVHSTLHGSEYCRGCARTPPKRRRRRMPR